MGLFTNKPQATDTITFFSTGLQKSLLLVGLGNPGTEYDLTRHNIGFDALDAFVDKNSDMGDWQTKKDLKCLLSSGTMGQNRIIAIKPTTFMNLSGEAVQATAQFYKVALENIVVIHDDLDVDFGQIRMRIGGSAAGNNGIKSVSQHLGEEYGRVRIGIGPKNPPQIDSADFVLQKLNKDEQLQLDNLKRETNAILSEFVYGGRLPHETRSFIV